MSSCTFAFVFLFFFFFSKLALTQFHFPLFLVASLFFFLISPSSTSSRGVLNVQNERERKKIKIKTTKTTTIFSFRQAPPRLPLGEYLALVSERNAQRKDALLARACDCCVAVRAEKKNHNGGVEQNLHRNNDDGHPERGQNGS